MRKLFFIVLSSFLFISCSENDAIPETNSELDKTTIEFIYESTTYFSTAQYDTDSNLIFDNKEVGELYESLQALPELAALVEKDKPIQYFNSSTELKEVLGLNEDNAPQLRGPRYDGDVTLDFYDQANYNGRHVSVTKEIWNGFWHIPLITEYYPEDCLTSIKITSRLQSPRFRINAIFCQKVNWEGKSLAFLDFQNLYEPNFGNYICTKPSMWTHSKYWNEVISSMHLWFNYNE
ncbi:MAG: hypothetical protein E6772_08235 [Dysgonomonas sp.]|nr:hypothetical protein [Dysgonomonas sp.]